VGVILPIFWAIDPGSARCGVVLYRPGSTLAEDRILESVVLPPGGALKRIQERRVRHLVLEMPRAIHCPTSNELLEAVLWAGRMAEAYAPDFHLVYRPDVKRHMGVVTSGRRRTGNADTQIRAALIRMYGEPGTKRDPGRTYGLAGDAWAALAVAATWVAKKRGEA
jgi:hypothetical protein